MLPFLLILGLVAPFSAGENTAGMQLLSKPLVEDIAGFPIKEKIIRFEGHLISIHYNFVLVEVYLYWNMSKKFFCAAIINSRTRPTLSFRVNCFSEDSIGGGDHIQYKDPILRSTSLAS